MNFLKRNHTTSLFKHLLFWIAVLIFFIIAQIGNRTVSFSELILINLLNLVAPFFATYIFNYVLIPFLYLKRKYVLFSLLFVVLAYIFSVSARLITVYLVEPAIRSGEFVKEPLSEILTNLSPLIYIYFPTIFVVTLSMTFMNQIKMQNRMRQRNLLLEKQKAETELKFLKMQINPHFLFNTLNNLYVLCLKKSDRAPDTVLRLSEILDYLLHSSENKLVSVQKEINLIENYIGLEKLRFDNHSLNVEFKKEIIDPDIKVSPLLLLTLVENAFKHGTRSGNLKNSIAISLSVQDNHLKFEIVNSKRKTLNGPKSADKGIGLKNLRQQLEMTYRHFDLKVLDENEYFKVSLEIFLESVTEERSGIHKTTTN